MSIIRFERFGQNPVMPITQNTFYSVHSANPDVLLFNGKFHFYFRGCNDALHDQIGVAFSDPDDFDGIHWEMSLKNPIVPVGENANDFDSNCVLDPGSVEFDRRIYLYYTANNASGIPSIGLAISSNGTHFNNQEEFIVFSPSKQEGDFDRFSIATTRIWGEGPWFYMTYGGCDKFLDSPIAIGLARSKNLVNWERYLYNPIFTCGLTGSFDSAAMRFPEVQRIGTTYYMWYEGNDGFHSQIGLATFKGSFSEW